VIATICGATAIEVLLFKLFSGRRSFPKGMLSPLAERPRFSGISLGVSEAGVLIEVTRPNWILSKVGCRKAAEETGSSLPLTTF